jgi:hypothetical protein
MSKNSVAVLAVLAALSMPCAATPNGGGSFLDHARLGAASMPGASAISAGPHRGAFSSVGSFHSGVARSAHFGALDATPRSEPQTYAMLLASLGLLGFIARRRRRALRVAD